MFNDLSSPLALLLSRRSGKARDLVQPGPDAGQLATMLQAAARVPDHGKLAPWRFVEITDRAALAALIDSHYRRDKPDAGRLELESLAAFAHHAPTLVALLSVPKESHIPRFEQEMSAGCAAFALLMAAHAMGFAANWLTGPAALIPGEALGVPEGRIVGWFFIGTPAKPLEERKRPAPETVALRWPA